MTALKRFLVRMVLGYYCAFHNWSSSCRPCPWCAEEWGCR
jgi:hypothetical protein